MNEPPPRNSIRKPIIGTLALIAVSVMLCVAGLLLINEVLFGNQRGCTPDEQQAIEGRIHIDFPPSASNNDCGYVFLQGSDAWARFEMSPDDLDAFLQTTYVSSVSKQPISEEAHFHYNTRFVRDYLYGEYLGTSGSEVMKQFILIDIGNPEVYVVYFEAWF